jgi:hypothetical protein
MPKEQYWGLNSEPHACQAGALPLEPLYLPLFGYFEDRVS